jgi:hypothetical protein
MPKQRLGVSLSLALLLATSAGSVAAQQSGPQATPLTAMECGGQYECVEDRPLTPAEARASLGSPQVVEPQEAARQEPAKVAATPARTTN